MIHKYNLSHLVPIFSLMCLYFMGGAGEPFVTGMRTSRQWPFEKERKMGNMERKK